MREKWDCYKRTRIQPPLEHASVKGFDALVREPADVQVGLLFNEQHADGQVGLVIGFVDAYFYAFQHAVVVPEEHVLGARRCGQRVQRSRIRVRGQVRVEDRDPDNAPGTADPVAVHGARDTGAHVVLCHDTDERRQFYF